MVLTVQKLGNFMNGQLCASIFADRVDLFPNFCASNIEGKILNIFSEKFSKRWLPKAVTIHGKRFFILSQGLFDFALIRSESGLVGDHYDVGPLRPESRTVNVKTKLKCVLAEVSLRKSGKIEILQRSYRKIQRKRLRNAKLRKFWVSAFWEWGGEKFALTYQLFSSSLHSTHSVRISNYRSSYSKRSPTILRVPPFKSSRNFQFNNTSLTFLAWFS